MSVSKHGELFQVIVSNDWMEKKTRNHAMYIRLGKEQHQLEVARNIGTPIRRTYGKLISVVFSLPFFFFFYSRN